MRAFIQSYCQQINLPEPKETTSWEEFEEIVYSWSNENKSLTINECNGEYDFVKMWRSPKGRLKMDRGRFGASWKEEIPKLINWLKNE